MKRFIFFPLLLFVSLNMFAQQDVHFSQYMFNNLIVNPAYAGSKEEISTSFFYRRQWINLNGAPNFQSFSIHAPLNYNRVGLGLNILNESVVANQSLNIQLCYSYKINFSRGKLAFGLATGLRQLSFDPSRLEIKDPDDPLLASGKQNRISPDFAFGSYYQHKNFYVGVSVQHLLANHSSRIYKNARHYYLTGAYRVKLGRSFELIPSTLVKYVQGVPVQIDLTTHLMYLRIGWIGFSYRSGDAAAIQGGINVDGIFNTLRHKLKIGYAYDMTVSELKKATSGSHEIMLICDFEIPRKSKSILQKKKSSVSPLFF